MLVIRGLYRKDRPPASAVAWQKLRYIAMFWGELRFGEFASTCFELPESCSRELTCTRTMSRELLSQGRLTWRELGHLAWALANLEAAPSQCLHRLNVPHRLCCVVISGSFPYQVWDLDLILAVQQDSERQCLSLSTSGCLVPCEVFRSAPGRGSLQPFAECLFPCRAIWLTWHEAPV